MLVLSDLDQRMATLAFETAMLVAMALEESLTLLARWLARCLLMLLMCALRHSQKASVVIIDDRVCISPLDAVSGSNVLICSRSTGTNSGRVRCLSGSVGE